MPAKAAAWYFIPKLSRTKRRPLVPILPVSGLTAAVAASNEGNIANKLKERKILLNIDIRLLRKKNYVVSSFKNSTASILLSSSFTESSSGEASNFMKT